MIIESTQRLIRIASLIVATAMFTGMWANDVPPRVGTEFRFVTLVELPDEELPAEAPVVSVETKEEPEWEALSPLPVVATVPAVSEDDDGWIAIDPFEKLRESKASQKGTAAIQKAASLPVSRTVDHDGLTLSVPAIQQHVELLPESLPNGDYRIIDEFGGVGWLMIRGQQGHLPVEEGVWTTTIDGKTVRFIRVAPQPDRVV
ncbi:hypothetical protein [Planctomicrobium sp. SH527]|uniref:hypothetical protein n=1 Tax=Planctomicrobium sp. SH527 TaxID=3448123 RepID=UPI003F5B8A6C